MIKKFHQYVTEELNFRSRKDIRKVAAEYGIIDYSINEDGSIDVDGNVQFGSSGYSYAHGGYRNVKFNKLPLKFNYVRGYFSCNNKELSSLEGCPIEVRGSFDCSNNRLYTLDHCPRRVGGEFKYLGNPVSEIINVFPTNKRKRVCEVWNDFEPIFKKDHKWHISEYRLRELYLDVTGQELNLRIPEYDEKGIEYSFFDNYTLKVTDHLI